jgi:hypothetical protein
VTVTDDRGAVSFASSPLALSVAPPNQPPVVLAPALVTVGEGDTISVPVSATDADGDPILDMSSNLASLPAADGAEFMPLADLSGGQLVWHTTYADSGTYVVMFVAGNDLADTAWTVIHVVNTDRAPIVTVPGPTFELAEGAPFTLDVTGADPDGDTIASLVANVSPPPGVAPAFSPAQGAASGTLAWTPSFADARHVHGDVHRGERAPGLHLGHAPRRGHGPRPLRWSIDHVFYNPLSSSYCFLFPTVFIFSLFFFHFFTFNFFSPP